MSEITSPKPAGDLRLKEKLSYALTNSGQTMVYALFCSYLLMYFTDYLHISTAVAGIILLIARIFDAINDPFMGLIIDRTNTKWGKCKPYMLFTPIPIVIFTLLMFAPFRLSGGWTIAYASIIYLLFTMIYTANDIPYWSMSAVITTEHKQRVSIVTLTRLIGGLGSAVTIALFWTANKFISASGADDRWSFFLSAGIFAIIGCVLMLQGFFNTHERAVYSSGSKTFFENLKLIPKSRSLIINLIAGTLMAVAIVGTTAMNTYFIKWNVKEVVSGMDSNTIMSIFTPLLGFLPALALGLGLIIVPSLIKKYEKRDLLLVTGGIGIAANIIFYFVGYDNLFLFVLGRFIASIPFGIWASVTTIMFGDAVDELEFKTGKRLEGMCFSLLTFVGKFQNGISAAIIGVILAYIGYNGELDPDIAQQSPMALKGIFFMVTLVSAMGLLLMILPFLFYTLNRKTHESMLEAIKERKGEFSTDGE